MKTALGVVFFDRWGGQMTEHNNNPTNGRIDWLKRDLVDLRAEMRDGFLSMQKEISEVKMCFDGHKEYVSSKCSDERSRIYERIERNTIQIFHVKEKLFKYLIVGSSIGFVLGTILTAILNKVIMNY